MAYTFVQGIDYGPRRGTRGLAIHMAEGDHPVAWLRRRPGETSVAWRSRVRGVSANFVIDLDGTIVQMVAWGRASGSMNPHDESDSVGFYRQDYCDEVLGAGEPDPNAWSISVEMAGFRANGPTADQLRALLELTAEARRRYPTLRGAFGHADQTKTKGCPGQAPRMLDYWGRVGHGLWRKTMAATDGLDQLDGSGGGSQTFAVGTPVFDRPGGTQVGTIRDAKVVYRIAAIYDPPGDEAPGGSTRWKLLDGGGAGRLRWVKA